MKRDFKLYIINFLAAKVNLAAFHQYLNDSVDVLGFWNYIPAVYCVKSRLEATALRDKLRPFLPDMMMVVEIDPFNMNGYMPSAEVWDWFFEPASEKRSPLSANLLEAFGARRLPPPPY